MERYYDLYSSDEKLRAEALRRLNERRERRKLEGPKKRNRKTKVKKEPRVIEAKDERLERAKRLVYSYKRQDEKKKRGECTLTALWIRDNIFPHACFLCGESDWTKIGCDRIDNSKPHTEDNVRPCCAHCNKTKDFIPINERLKMKKNQVI